MKFEDEAKLILEAVAKTASSDRTRKLARNVSGRVATGVKSLGFRVFSEVMDRIGDAKETSDESTKPYIAKPVSAQDAALRFSQKRAPTVSATEEQEPTETSISEKPQKLSTNSKDRISTRPTTSNKRYGINRVVLLIRHPGRAFAYWEIDEQRVAEDANAWLDLIDADSGQVLEKVAGNPIQGKQYFDVDRSDGRYVVELYLLNEEGDKSLLSRSHPAQYDPENPTGSQPPTKNDA